MASPHCDQYPQGEREEQSKARAVIEHIKARYEKEQEYAAPRNNEPISSAEVWELQGATVEVSRRAIHG